MSPQRISVALCTYEGERYIGEQLDSIASQTRRPDELVVYDDGSSDGTMQILERFQATAPFPLRISRQPIRVGSSTNFAHALAACRGEILFLADQDDRWLPDKLARQVAAFADDPTMAGVFTNARLIDGASDPIAGTLWDHVKFSPPRVASLTSTRVAQRLCRGDLVTGATLAIRRDFLGVLLPVPKGWVHDAWIALVLASLHALRFLPECLIEYRLHPGQQIGLGPGGSKEGRSLWSSSGTHRRMRKNEREVFRRRAQALQSAVDRLAPLAASPSAPVLEELRSALRHFRSRGSLASVNSNRLLFEGLLSEFLSGRYRRYSSGIFSLLKDLCLLRSGAR